MTPQTGFPGRLSGHGSAKARSSSASRTAGGTVNSASEQYTRLARARNRLRRLTTTNP